MVYTPTFPLFVIYCKTINLKANSKWEGQKKEKKQKKTMEFIHSIIFYYYYFFGEV